MKIEKLQYITQGKTEDTILEEIESVVNAGVSWVQLRVKDPLLPFEKIAFRAKVLCANKATFIINDKVDVCKLINADGVHLGLTDMPIAQARSILGKQKIIGGTANTLEDCLMRQSEGVDYIGLGPYKFTQTKEKLSPLLGLQGYLDLTKDTRLQTPIVAVGGIALGDVLDLVSVGGVWGIAVSGLIKHSSNQAGLITQLNTILNNG